MSTEELDSTGGRWLAAREPVVVVRLDEATSGPSEPELPGRRQRFSTLAVVVAVVVGLVSGSIATHVWRDLRAAAIVEDTVEVALSARWGPGHPAGRGLLGARLYVENRGPLPVRLTDLRTEAPGVQVVGIDPAGVEIDGRSSARVSVLMAVNCSRLRPVARPVFAAGVVPVSGRAQGAALSYRETGPTWSELVGSRCESALADLVTASYDGLRPDGDLRLLTFSLLLRRGGREDPVHFRGVRLPWAPPAFASEPPVPVILPAARVTQVLVRAPLPACDRLDDVGARVEIGYGYGAGNALGVTTTVRAVLGLDFERDFREALAARCS